MSNASLQGNVAQEIARRRVTEELLPRQARLNQQYGPPDIPIPATVAPYQTFEQPSDNVKGFFDAGYGGSPDSVDAPATDAAPGSGVSPAVANASAVSNAVNSPMGMVAAALAPMGVPIAMALNAQANNTLDTALANQAAEEAMVSLDVFGPDADAVSAPDAGPDGPGGPATGDGSGGPSDAGGTGGGTSDGSGDGGGGGGGGGKIVCTAMNQAYGFGSFRQAVWLDYSRNHLTKQHERGYHRIFKPIVKYAFHSGNGMINKVVRRFIEKIMRLRTADIRAEMRGKNPHPVRRVIRQACEYICYGVGKL